MVGTQEDSSEQHKKKLDNFTISMSSKLANATISNKQAVDEENICLLGFFSTPLKNSVRPLPIFTLTTECTIISFTTCWSQDEGLRRIIIHVPAEM